MCSSNAKKTVCGFFSSFGKGLAITADQLTDAHFVYKWTKTMAFVWMFFSSELILSMELEWGIVCVCFVEIECTKIERELIWCRNQTTLRTHSRPGWGVCRNMLHQFHHEFFKISMIHHENWFCCSQWVRFGERCDKRSYSKLTKNFNDRDSIMKSVYFTTRELCRVKHLHANQANLCVCMFN